MSRNYFNAEVLFKIAQSQLVVCSTDPRLGLRDELLDKNSPLHDLKHCPGIFYARVKAHEPSKHSLVLKLVALLDSCTVKPRLQCFTIATGPSQLVEPHHFFRDLNQYIAERINGSGYFILVLDRLHRLSFSQLLFLKSSIKLSKLQCGIVLITTSEYIHKFKNESPTGYREFRKAVDIEIKTRRDILWLKAANLSLRSFGGNLFSIKGN